MEDSGTIALIFVVILRLCIPFVILKRNLFGAMLAVIADASDVMIFEKFGSGPLTDLLYHNFDKVFDIYYLSFELYVLLQWSDQLAKRMGIFLYALRVLGFVIFEVSTVLFPHPFRPILLLAPNIFENFFVSIVVVKKFVPEFKLTSKTVLIILFVASVPKLIQEYIMHYKYPDKTWYFLRDHLFFFLYR